MHFDGGIWKIERFSLKVMAVSFFFSYFCSHETQILWFRSNKEELMLLCGFISC